MSIRLLAIITLILSGGYLLMCIGYVALGTMLAKYGEVNYTLVVRAGIVMPLVSWWAIRELIKSYKKDKAG